MADAVVGKSVTSGDARCVSCCTVHAADYYGQAMALANESRHEAARRPLAEWSAARRAGAAHDGRGDPGMRFWLPDVEARTRDLA